MIDPMNPMTFQGTPVITSPFAESIKWTTEVKRWPIEKKRRGWTVVRTMHKEPCAYIMDGVIVMHPVLVAKLKAAYPTFEGVPRA